MKASRLTTSGITLHNLTHRAFRSGCLLFLVALLSFALFSGSVIAGSLTNGIDSMSRRLGADLMIVPQGYEKDAAGALLRGEPSTFYFDGAMKDKIASVKGVKEVSPQLFISSFSHECCSWPVQLIGFDPKTDFAITPWLTGQLKKTLGDFEIVIGSSVDAQVGETLSFFDRDYLVIGQLEKTGMGFDTSVFMNMDSAWVAAADYTRLGGFIQHEENSISSLIVNVEAGVKVLDVNTEILRLYGDEGIDVILSQNLLRNISSGLDSLPLILGGLSLLLWLLAAGVLAAVFSLSIHERKREFAILRAIGATRKKLSGIILLEASYISLAGSVAGLFLASLFLFPYSASISKAIDAPYLQPGLGILVLYALGSLVLAFLTGPAAAAFSAIKIGRSETYTMIREGE